MSRIFADTFYFLALLHEKDAAHHRAVEFTAHHQVRILTTAWILTELADYLCAVQSRHRFANLYRTLRTEQAFTILPPDVHVFDEALDLYFQRPDKNWSLTDCTSFVMMQQHGIFEALTGDHHFEQAGFVALLK